jgi:hypothetical protein
VPKAKKDLDPRAAWGFFLLFTLVHSLLAYGSLPLIWELWVGLLGWVLPLALACSLGPVPTDLPLKKEPHPWVWLSVALLGGALVRLWSLSDFFRFPLHDEIINAYFAQHLGDHWTWRPFFYWSQLPPLYIWGLALMDKVFGASPWTLWGWPALLSFLSIPIYYAAARLFFRGWVPVLFAFLMACSFWPVFVGRFSHQANALVLLESLCFLAWGKLHVAQTPRERSVAALCLGAALGVGFYTYFAWPLVAFLFFSTFAWRAFTRPKEGTRDLFWTGAATGLVLLPLVVGAMRQGYGSYLSSLLPGHVNPDNVGPEDLSQKLLYVTTFLWGGLKSHFAYNPWWGGFLNPILGSLFSLGILDLFGRRKEPFARWMFFAFALLFFPILLANNTNWFHVAPLLPWFLLVTAMGGVLLWNSTPSPGRWLATIPLVFLSLGSDQVNLAKTRDYVNQHQVSPPLLKAFQVLKEKADQEGPGLIFPLFNSSVADVRLATMVHPFNRAENPGEARWAAVWTSRRDQPLVDKLFSGTRVLELTNGTPLRLSDEMLVFIPVIEINRERLDLWTRAHQELDGFVWSQLNCPRHSPRSDLLEQMLMASKGHFQKDPILAMSLWELVSQAFVESGDPPMALRAKIVAFSCRHSQTAMDEYQLGLLYMKNNDPQNAKACFTKAGELDPDFAAPAGWLEGHGKGLEK